MSGVLEELFPHGVVAIQATPELEGLALYPEEEARTPRMAPRRRREFALGRACARRALARLGVERFPLLNDAERVPIWPPELIGSITHCDGFCAAAVARRGSLLGIGLDAEPARSLEPRLVERICSPAERERLAALPRPGDWALLAFSAKESFYKCYFPIARTFLGFHDVDLDLDPARQRFSVRLLADAPSAAGARVFRGRFRRDGRHVVTAVSLRAEE